MPYDFTIHNKGDHIRAEISGKRIRNKEVEDMVRVLFHVTDFCRKEGISRILIISSLTGRIPAIAAYEIAQYTEKHGWNRSFKIADVDLNKESLEDSLFIETVAVNRGYRFRVFDNEKDAESWLLEY
jgi:hypothetical protein